MTTENPVDALQAMAKRTALAMVARELQVLAGAGAVTITLHPETPEQLALPPKPARRGRKPGPKPKTGRAWTPAQRARFLATMAARRKPTAAPVEKRKPGRPKKVVVPDEARCVACDHTKGEHDPQTGKCLSWRCVCASFAR